MSNHLRHLKHYDSSAFGRDKFGILAEGIAKTFGTPKYLIIQSTLVVVWVLLNVLVISLRWDPYPFILLNLMFSTQASYAAPLILLAQTRQADRDKAHAEATASHNQEESDYIKRLIEDNTKLTKEVHKLTEDIHTSTLHKERSE